MRILSILIVGLLLSSCTNSYVKNKKTITLVEWPQIIVNKNNAKSIDLLYSYENEFKNRTVQIKVLN